MGCWHWVVWGEHQPAVCVTDGAGQSDTLCVPLQKQHIHPGPCTAQNLSMHTCIPQSSSGIGLSTTGEDGQSQSQGLDTTVSAAQKLQHLSSSAAVPVPALCCGPHAADRGSHQGGRQGAQCVGRLPQQWGCDCGRGHRLLQQARGPAWHSINHSSTTVAHGALVLSAQTC